RRQRSQCFPYTTLFRSFVRRQRNGQLVLVAETVQLFGRISRYSKNVRSCPPESLAQGCEIHRFPGAAFGVGFRKKVEHKLAAPRSEEHTSELQSRENLV